MSGDQKDKAKRKDKFYFHCKYNGAHSFVVYNQYTGKYLDPDGNKCQFQKEKSHDERKISVAPPYIGVNMMSGNVNHVGCDHRTKEEVPMFIAKINNNDREDRGVILG